MKFRFVLPLMVLFGSPPVLGVETLHPVGVRSVMAPEPERGATLEIAAWYPAATGGTLELVGDSAVFAGVPARRDAPIASGSFPVILLGHGGMRAAPYLGAWIASRLAARGFFVIAPRSPNPADLMAENAVRELWLRPSDLSAALTVVEQDPDFSRAIDKGRVGALGFQFGGTSILALAGARIDGQAYARSCDEDGTGLDCAWFARSGVDLHKVDVDKLERPLLDRRVKSVVAVDPELAASFSTVSLPGIAIPVHLINLGQPVEIPPGLGASGLLKSIPRSRYDLLPDATRFDAFNPCKPDGAAILRDDGDDEGLCDAGKRPRAQIHEELAAMIAAAFAQDLQDGM